MNAQRQLLGTLLGVSAALLFLAQPVFAATLSLSSASTNVVAGSVVTVRIALDSGGQAINAGEATLQFPPDLLQVVSLDKSASIFSLWVEEPSFSNESGQVTFSGGLPTPGYQGGNGTVLTVSFRAKQSGIAALSLTDASVRANDGLGTDVLQVATGEQLTITNAPPAPKPVAPQSTAPAPAPAPSAAVNTVAAPFLSALPPTMDSETQLIVQGTVMQPGLDVSVYLAKDGAAPTIFPATQTQTGAFILIGPVLQTGTYEVWAVAISRDGISSAPSEKMQIAVSEPPVLTVGPIELSLAEVLFAMLILTLGSFIAAVIGWYKVLHHHRLRK